MPKKTSLGKMKVSFALVIIIICAVATTVAVYWIKTEVPEQAPQTIKSDPTANWPVYKNEKYGFEFRYPKEWIQKAINGMPAFIVPSDLIGKGKEQILVNPRVEVSIKAGEYKDLNEFLNKWEYNNQDLASLWNISGQEYHEINGSAFFKYEYTHQVFGVVYLTIKNGDLFRIKFIDETARGGKYLKAYGDFLRLISSFKFIN